MIARVLALSTRDEQAAVTGQDDVHNREGNFLSNHLVGAAGEDRRLIRLGTGVLSWYFPPLAGRDGGGQQDKDAEERPGEGAHLTETLTILAPSRMRSTNSMPDVT